MTQGWHSCGYSGRVFWRSGCGGDGFCKAGICDCCRSAIIKCIQCPGGICIGWVVVVVVVMVGYWW